MSIQGSSNVEGAYSEWSWDQRVETAAERIVQVCHRLGADWWPTPDADVHRLLLEALSRSAVLLLAEQPTLTFD